MPALATIPREAHDARECHDEPEDVALLTPWRPAHAAELSEFVSGLSAAFHRRRMRQATSSLPAQSADVAIAATICSVPARNRLGYGFVTR